MTDELTAPGRIKAAEATRNRAVWPYFPGPIFIAFVWIFDDAQGAFFTAVGMLLAILFCMYEVGRKAEIDAMIAATEGGD